MMFAVAAAFTKSIPTGLNIQCAIRKIDGVSKEEAIGKFVLTMSEKLPNHNIHIHPLCVPCEDAPQNTMEAPGTDNQQTNDVMLCDQCSDDANCSGCLRFSRHCKKCTDGG